MKQACRHGPGPHEQLCENCYYYVPKQAPEKTEAIIWGHCHKNPPVRVEVERMGVSAHGINWEFCFTEVSADDWCGAYVGREDSTEVYSSQEFQRRILRLLQNVAIELAISDPLT